jgi:hypothetical protein
MLPDNFIKSIKLITSELQNKNIKWALVGTTNLALQGLDVKPNDLDIVTFANHIQVFERIFKDYIIKPLTKKISSTKGCPDYYILMLSINGVEIEVMGEFETNVYFSKVGRGEIEEIDLEGMRIPCLNLSSEANAYEKLGRNKKVEMIKDFIKP